MQPLPSALTPFTHKKAKILQQLALPDAAYSDASPKGSVDVGVRDLVDEINGVDGFVTTSSCAGRVSVFLEGWRNTAAAAAAAASAPAAPPPPPADDDARHVVAGVGGKGAGGMWLFVSHDPLPQQVAGGWAQHFHLETPPAGEQGVLDPGNAERRLIHFKFEPLVGFQKSANRRRVVDFSNGMLRMGARFSTF